MAAIDQLTIQGSNVVNDIHDRRITTTAITTCTHILASQAAGLTSIAPITAANLASVLGGATGLFSSFPVNLVSDANLLTMKDSYGYNGIYCYAGDNGQRGFAIVYYTGTTRTIQIKVDCETDKVFIRRNVSAGSFSDWCELTLPAFYKNYSTLAELKAALDAL